MTATIGRSAALLVACDGSCLKNPGGPIGWAWVTDENTWESGCQPAGTNQIAELAALLAVLLAYPDRPLTVQIDSEYAMKCAGRWAKQWARRGWVTANGTPVKNLALVQHLHTAMTSRPLGAVVTLEKVPGHDPNNRWPLNTRADEKARAAAEWAQNTGRANTFG